MPTRVILNRLLPGMSCKKYTKRTEVLCTPVMHGNSSQSPPPHNRFCPQISMNAVRSWTLVERKNRIDLVEGSWKLHEINLFGTVQISNLRVHGGQPICKLKVNKYYCFGFAFIRIIQKNASRKDFFRKNTTLPTP